MKYLKYPSVFFLFPFIFLLILFNPFPPLSILSSIGHILYADKPLRAPSRWKRRRPGRSSYKHLRASLVCPGLAARSSPRHPPLPLPLPSPSPSSRRLAPPPSCAASPAPICPRGKPDLDARWAHGSTSEPGEASFFQLPPSLRCHFSRFCGASRTGTELFDEDAFGFFFVFFVLMTTDAFGC